MSIIQRLLQRSNEPQHPRGITLAFLGDSVTQGCFEVYTDREGKLQAVTEQAYAYPQLVHKRLALLYPAIPFHIINAGRSGDRATGGLKRVARDVIAFRPDLTVVCYGLNDCTDTVGGIDTYTTALEGILTQLRAAGSEVIFMTPNMMNTSLSPHITDPAIRTVAERKMALQMGGYMTQYIHAARALCQRLGVRVCDCYALWEAMRDSGVEVTELLCNQINHPARELHALFAEELVKAMLDKEPYKEDEKDENDQG